MKAKTTTQYLAINLIIITLIQCIMTHNIPTKKPNRYRIDLDQPLEPQYAKVYQDYVKPLEDYKNFLMSHAEINYYFGWSKYLSFFQSTEWHNQINMYAKISNLGKEFFTVYNMAYDVACTSIIVRNKENQVYMGRNLDYSGAKELATLAVEYEMYRDNKLQYISVGSFGFLGIYNAIVPGQYVVSINQRETSTTSYNLMRFCFGFRDPLYNLHQVVEKANNYNDAFKLLSETYLNAPVYYIISGVKNNEGAVIARHYNKPALIDYLTDDIWFLVQTNYDRNLPDPEQDYRRVPAENKIKAFGSDLKINDLFDVVLSQSPNFKDSTILTVLTSAQDNSFNTTVYLR